ncbi:MAG: class II aldolase/adducin family protein, partial [Halioglobus sp.]|nr:class II aldolase/adducin family protein [Halioglobus sp.]
TLCAGLSRSDVFAQLVADIGDIDVSVPHSWQTSALGAAVCAAVGVGHYGDFSAACAALCNERRRISPRTEQAQDNRQLFSTWLRFHEQAQQATAPVAVDHVLPRVLREPPASAPPPDFQHRPQALICAAFDDDSLDALRAVMALEYASFRESRRLLTGPGLVSALAGKQVFVTEVDVVDAASLQQLPALRVVAACRGNAVNVDVDACTAYGIPVLYAPGRNAIAVADLAVGFMISLARKLPAAARFLRDPDCSAGNMGKMGQAFSQLQGVELWRKTIGLIGLGAVGRAVARRLAGFEATVLVADPFVSAEQAALAGCELTDLDTLLHRADFVSLHAAVTPATTGMLGAAQFARMRPGAFLINTARAALVDEQALLNALESGQLGGAALDTFALEPPGHDHPLVQHPAVMCTPHSAGNTREVAAHQGASIAQALLQLLRGERPCNVLNPATLDTFSWDGPRREPDARELARLAESAGPAVTDLQRDSAAVTQEVVSPTAEIAAPTAIVETMRAILTRFCAALEDDANITAFSTDQALTLHFTVHDLGLQFFIGLQRGHVSSALGAPPQAAEVQLQMRGEILDGMFTGTIDTMECAMNGDIAFMGDAAKAMALQHMSADMERLYQAARAAVGDPGDLASVPRPGRGTGVAAVAGPGDPREDLVNIMRELYESQVITATGGNISVRIPDTDGELWITPSRLFKGDLKPEVMVRINLRGESLDPGSRSPSSEWCMHTRVLELKPEANAVIHAHAPNATILANAGLPFLPISTEAAFFGNIARIPFCMPGTPELADAVGEAMGDDWAVLMINHGILVAGRSLRRAADMVEIIERSAEIILGCHAVGVEPPVLPPDAAAHFRKLGDIVA